MSDELKQLKMTRGGPQSEPGQQLLGQSKQKNLSVPLSLSQDHLHLLEWQLEPKPKELKQQLQMFDVKTFIERNPNLFPPLAMQSLQRNPTIFLIPRNVYSLTFDYCGGWLKQFCSSFKDINDFEIRINNSNAAALIAQADVQTLKDACAGNIWVGWNFIHIGEMHLLYIHGYLAKLGIQCWGPDLEEGPESLFNSACRIAALKTFQQVAGAGSYDFMNFNHDYKDNMVRFIDAYNHYVHHVSSKKFQAKIKQPGKYKETLCDARYKFAVANYFPEQYQKIIKEITANSDDEWDPNAKCFSIRCVETNQGHI
ncbi:uncharacterized protein PGTG_12387 [Puccinia graminis f. sp. tritici CRL 75-36-700-3]|uniref:Uncharacterized protein n=1 Tax=Puccinia graminis f. sp. tritici (strain CRL 75-36-700-3 / race SCCL) TaxID=418459 RepID=E3KQ56_PUCGT|nr:uncharacterized protein PGTG_12387 [Puccinia graminis f. sp. tritici CRL 75-36-700-3]EFP86431.2 hypothetical protein PGTG_12387 [Puccinia graminis f. sp. tritici CRL 75-36-700-3]